MCTREAAAALAALAAAGACAAGPDLGQPITPAEIAAWDISVSPSGEGLPPGSGTAAQGAAIYAQKCAACHGQGARGGTNVALVGGGPIERIDSVRTIKNFWPYSTTLFDYIRRAMPWPQPRSLSNDEVYALTAYILAENRLIAADAVMDATTLPQVKMPNRDGFIVRFPGEL